MRLAERGGAVDATLRDAAGQEIEVSAGVRSALEAAGTGHYAGLVDMVDGDPGSGFALVRPDGILAARGSAGDTHRVIDYLRRLCGHSEPGPAAAPVLSEVVAP